ncbi:hypothetical protein PENANT_c001G11678 [Penicillium antarcticum]|uniref:Uncharacterized protein n=1 Tax=Penicillium antarcticum TaxID=416450 RepID=A0A1V6QMN9_9EURO|nr:uncharacterized protein N7508_010323 [Penicillium antarcticum]KAJ5295502.1 hypothetical protein N7508_010323 [Penicillium antarcticum]OQD90451.1 hypothetical protein PENANT_c001G11678 [Penicillium antarcticum]
MAPPIPYSTPGNPADAQGDNLVSYLVRMYEVLNNPIFRHVSALSVHEDLHFKPRISKATDEKKRCFDYILNTEYPSLPPNLATRLRDLGIKFLLRTAQVCIREHNPDEAEKHTKDAINIAKSIPDEILTSRCQFWLGRVEFLRDNFDKAHTHFTAAQNSVMDDYCIEGEEVRLYMDITRHGISEESRARRLEDYKRACEAGVRYEPSNNDSISLYSRKRKRPIKTWKGILQNPERGIELPVILSEPLCGKISPIYDGLRPQAPKSTVDSLKATQGFDSASDLSPARPNTVSKSSNPIPSIEFVVNDDKIHEPYRFGIPVEASQIKKFTFGCVHIGVSKRSRPTNIFPRQPGEFVMSNRDWESIEKRARTEIVTMDYLRREMEGLAMVAEDI